MKIVHLLMCITMIYGQQFGLNPMQNYPDMNLQLPKGFTSSSTSSSSYSRVANPSLTQPGLSLPNLNSPSLTLPSITQPSLIQPVWTESNLNQQAFPQPSLIPPVFSEPGLLQSGFNPPNLLQPDFNQFGFPPMDFNFPNKIQQDMDQSFKAMQISEAKSSIQNGMGGTTIVESPGRNLIKKDGTTLECSGPVVFQQPFCLGQLRRFQINTLKDFCYSEHYSKLNNMLCIGQPDHTAINFNFINGKYSCRGSDERPAATMSLNEYHIMCGKMPWDKVYHYYPDMNHPFHVNLPDSNLGCREMRRDVCVFKIGETVHLAL